MKNIDPRDTVGNGTLAHELRQGFVGRQSAHNASATCAASDVVDERVATLNAAHACGAQGKIAAEYLRDLPLPSSMLEELLVRLSRIAERVAITANQVEALGERLFGAQPDANSSAGAAATMHLGVVGDLESYATTIEARLDRLGHAVDRVSRVA